MKGHGGLQLPDRSPGPRLASVLPSEHCACFHMESQNQNAGWGNRPRGGASHSLSEVGTLVTWSFPAVSCATLLVSLTSRTLLKVGLYVPFSTHHNVTEHRTGTRGAKSGRWLPQGLVLPALEPSVKIL